MFRNEGPKWKRDLSLIQFMAGIIIIPVCLSFLFLWQSFSAFYCIVFYCILLYSIAYLLTIRILLLVTYFVSTIWSRWIDSSSTLRKKERGVRISAKFCGGSHNIWCKTPVCAPSLPTMRGRKPLQLIVAQTSDVHWLRKSTRPTSVLFDIADRNLCAEGQKPDRPYTIISVGVHACKCVRREYLKFVFLTLRRSAIRARTKVTQF